MVTVIQAWDDGVAEDARLVELFRRLDIPAAFNLNPGLYRPERSFGWMDGEHAVHRLGWSEMRAVYAGFEIAAHSLTHPRLTGLDDDRLRDEVAGSKARLEDFFQQPVTGFCYPFNDYDDRILAAVRAAGFRYARGTGPAETVFPPDEPLLLHPSCHFLDPAFTARYARARARDGVFFFWGHGYELRAETMWQEFEDKLTTINADPAARWATPGSLFGGVASGIGQRL